MGDQGAEVGTAEHRIAVTAGDGESWTIAATEFVPRNFESNVAPIVCLPGGGYNRRYFDLVVDAVGDDYSFARYAATRGHRVLTVDLLGTGESSRPVDGATLWSQADAMAEVVRWWSNELGDAPTPVCVAHSMGGYTAIIQQAIRRSYSALVILGTTQGPIHTLGLPQEMIDAASSPEGRAALYQDVRAGFTDPDVVGDRALMRSWFHLADVPDEVVAADDATTSTVSPRACAAASLIPGMFIVEAAAVEVPVFLGFGEIDVSADPSLEPAFFERSPSIELMVLAGSAHCHNMATTRRRLWDAALDWITV